MTDMGFTADILPQESLLYRASRHTEYVQEPILVRKTKFYSSINNYKGFPPAIISHTVWLYIRFSLSFRDVEELLAQRGIVITYETIRQWCLKFGQTYANELRRRRPRCGDKWHMDEVYLKINGKTHYLWRAVDQDGNMLDILVQSRRNTQAAKRFFRKLLKGHFPL